MEQWISNNLDKAAEIAGLGLCDRCLGRMFGKLGECMTNDVRGRMIREALAENGVETQAEEFCPLCENVFDMIGRFAEAAAEKVNEV